MSKKMEEGFLKILKRINTAHSDLRETSREIMEFMIDVFGADKAEIAVFREDFDIHTMELTEEGAVRFRLKWGYRREQWKMLEESGILLLSTRFALEFKESKVVTDTSEEQEEARKLSDYLGTGSWMNYILVLNEKVLANIHLDKKEHGYYRKKDLRRLEYLSQLLVTAINLSQMWERERTLMINFIQSLNKALEVRDEYTAGHVERVGFYSRVLASTVGMSDQEIEHVQTAAILHDIGKIGIADSVLKKKAGLSWEEKEVIRKHVPLTDEIFENLHHLDEARKIARYHHETFDGKGYVMGLKGEEIPVGSKILAIADAFDAMTSDRPYRKAFTVEEALTILNDPNITQWDKHLIGLFDSFLHGDEFLRLAEERGMIKYTDEERIFYDRESSILRFRDLGKFFQGTPTLEARFRKKKKMGRGGKIKISEVSRIR
ncbi:MAG: HD domain-containing protein [Candidatus Eremiobacteraeota bacterium]|nr:HD domain-containing protein [Candidatus Eremiobacteraeota bacterium]